MLKLMALFQKMRAGRRKREIPFLLDEFPASKYRSATVDLRYRYWIQNLNKLYMSKKRRSE